MKGAVFLAVLLAPVLADVYMHNPRGSNDRNCERNVNRNNGNRLFDSQNNNAGGYACPRIVGDESLQDEMGNAVFRDVDPNTGTSTTFTQNKRIYYYENSILPIEWTNQHGCGSNSKVSCEIVLQYACEDTLDPQVDDFWPWVDKKAEVGSKYRGAQHFRSDTHIGAPRDGVPRDANDAATDTIPDNENSAIASSKETRRYGQHESYDYYQLCQFTERNKGLYTADQQLRRTDRRGTRQNPNGNRNGFECPEERDYYPWWAPSPWIDIAVLTDNADVDELCTNATLNTCSDRCAYYMKNTMNFNKKGYCDANHATGKVSDKLNHNNWKNRVWFNNRAACEAAGFVWYEVSHRDNINLGADSFVCAQTQYARVNQLGNAQGEDALVSESSTGSGVLADHVNHGVNANRFLWQIPTIPTITKTPASSYFSEGMTSAYKSCTLRIRYNISTADFQQWPADANSVGSATMVDYRNNSKNSKDVNTPLLQDPYIVISPEDQAKSKGQKFVSLAVNTNQYGRTFQDRSYSFTIKPLPTSNVAESTKLDTPKIDATSIQARLSAGGRIYNVNVRGKRGNIVQTFPSVEYDFVPNALALTTDDMIHFQWTGSDYNPRRGCNNAEGGPPDPNDFISSANANINSRADRSNVVLLHSMAENVPTDYLGYNYSDSSIPYNTKTATAIATATTNAPCYDSATDSSATQEECYNTLIRLAYLNQQLDGGALVLRGGRDCLTEEELNEISDQENTAQNHPLNCAKLNAKPYPYFDGGVMMVRKEGWFPFYSSRNNNFSNRNQAGIICVGTCPLENNGVLQSQNPAITGKAVTHVAPATCQDTASDGKGANQNGAKSCISDDATVLKDETFTKQEGDNDNKGDGNKEGCEILTYSLTNKNTVEQQVALAIILLFVGLITSWLAYFAYNRYKLSQEKKGEGAHRGSTSWQGLGWFGKSKVPTTEMV